MEALMFISIILLGLFSLGFFIGGIVFIARDAGKHEQSVPLWVILFILLGNLGLGIYLIVTKRIGWGIFWIILPFIVFFIFFFLLVGAGGLSEVVAPFFL